jgi:hypothetical protein
MQIHEITKSMVKEGFGDDLKKVGSAIAGKGALSSIGSGFVQGLSGADFSRQLPVKSSAAKTDNTNPTQGAIFLVKGPGGMEYFKSHQGIWFEKPDSREIYSASGALQIKDPVKANKLNQLLPQAQTIYVKSAGQGDTINFVPDSSGRTAKLATNRLKPRVKK